LHLIGLIANLYLGQKVRVRIEGEYSEPRLIGRGVRQGCPLSGLLFNTYIEELKRETLENTKEGVKVKVGGKLIKALRFADDQAMLAGSQSDLQRMIDRLTMESVNHNMKINTKKTKVMRVSKGSESAMKIG